MPDGNKIIMGQVISPMWHLLQDRK